MCVFLWVCVSADLMTFSPFFKHLITGVSPTLTHRPPLCPQSQKHSLFQAVLQSTQRGSFRSTGQQETHKWHLFSRHPKSSWDKLFFFTVWVLWFWLALWNLISQFVCIVQWNHKGYFDYCEQFCKCIVLIFRLAKCLQRDTREKDYFIKGTNVSKLQQEITNSISKGCEMTLQIWQSDLIPSRSSLVIRLSSHWQN